MHHPRASYQLPDGLLDRGFSVQVEKVLAEGLMNPWAISHELQTYLNF
jgi:hypothetical protein